MTKNSLVIGVAGGSGSGKSTFAKRVRDYFADEAVLISCDNYYLAHDDIPIEKRAKLNYDIPEAFEFDLMIKQMAELKSGKSVECPVYDFTVHTRNGETIKIDPKPVVIIDGILALYEEKLRDVMDVKVFRRNRRGRAYFKARAPRRRRTRQKCRKYYRTISYDRQADALQIYRTDQAIRRHNHKRRFQRCGVRFVQDQDRKFFNRKS